MLFLPYSGRRYQLIDSKLINTRTGEPIPVVGGKCRLCWVDGDRDYDFPVIYYLCVTGAKVPDYLIGEMVVVFGDGGNDISMLRHAAIGVAMANSDDSVKESADYITGHVDDGGLPAALRHFGLIN